MIKMIFDTANNLMDKGPLGFALIIVILIGAGVHMWYVERLVDKFSVGACRGHPNKCVFNIAHAQGNMIRTKYEGLVEYISAKYTAIIIQQIEDKELIATSEQINNAIIHHKHLLTYCFAPAIEETKRLVRENGVPEDPKRRRQYIGDKFRGVWGTVWSRYRSDYRHSTLLLPYSVVESAQEDRMGYYKDFAEQLIEDGYNIAHEGDDEKKEI